MMTRQQGLLATLFALCIGAGIVAAQAVATPRALLILAGGFLPLVLALLPNLRRIGVALLILDCSLQIDTYLGHDGFDARFGATSGFVVSLSTLIIGCFLIRHLIVMRFRHQPNAPQVMPSSTTARVNVFMLMLLYCAIAAASIVVAGVRMRVLYELWSLLQVALTVWIVRRQLRTQADWLFIVYVMLGGLLLQGILMITLRVLGSSLEWGVINATIDIEGGMRVGGTLGSSNSVGGYLAMSILIGLGIALASVSTRMRILALSAVALGLIALILTLSRGSWLALLIGLAVFSALGLWHRLVKPGVVIAAALAALALLVPFRATLIERLVEDDAGSALSRIPLNQVAWNMIAEQPLLGIGLNNFDLAMQRYLTPDFTGIWQYTVHNRFLQIWSETGVLGLLAFFSVIAVAVMQGLPVIRQRTTLLAVPSLGLMAGFTTLLTHMLFEAFDARGITTLVWIGALLLTSATRFQPVEN
jgi:putative inorganic carbon (hco3(-)) transporter